MSILESKSWGLLPRRIICQRNLPRSLWMKAGDGNSLLPDNFAQAIFAISHEFILVRKLIKCFRLLPQIHLC
jgi:hypothetical protein